MDASSHDSRQVDAAAQPSVAVLCVGNKLMLDDGIGVAVFEQLSAYEFPDCVSIFDLGCLTMSQLDIVRDFDVVVTVDAIDGTGEPAGTIFTYEPDQMARRTAATASLHEMRLVDLFDSAALLGYEARGICLGMQVENASPDHVVVGLTAPVHDTLADLVDCVLATIVNLGHEVVLNETGEAVTPGFCHQLIEGSTL